MPLADILARIDLAVEHAGRPRGSVQLIAVSKVQPLDRVRAVLEAGHRIFGENRIQEADGKWPDLRAEFGPVELHLLGPLQTNKLARACELFDVIHSLDRDKLAAKLADAAQARGLCPGLFIQVNTGREPQKAGVDPDEIDRFIATCREIYNLPLLGLMAIPPAEEDPAPHFERLAEMAQRNGLTGLSMGMSGDFEAAIAHGATQIRVGSALFGERTALA